MALCILVAGNYIASGQCSILVNGGEISGDQTVCYGSKIALISKSPPTFNSYDDSYSWTYKWQCRENNSELWESYDGNVSPPILITSRSFMKTTQIRRQVTDNKGCVLYSNVITITVNPVPTVNTIDNITVCSNGPVNAILFGTTVSSPEVLYSWEADGNWSVVGLPSKTGTGNIEAFTAKSNTGTTAVSTTITVTPKIEDCSGPSKKFTITVNPVPTVNAIDDVTACSGGPVNAITFGTTINSPEVLYSWEADDNWSVVGLPSKTGTGDIVAFTANSNIGTAAVSTEITVTPKIEDCSGPSKKFTITVNPVPTVNAIDNVTACSNGSVNAVSFGTTINSPEVL
ncbi:MAG: hypothetical protein LBQ01_01285, partial [Prevotellaceae bacterium]|nr:hypothetical protein [Prevotellaceae bacterium]